MQVRQLGCFWVEPKSHDFRQFAGRHAENAIATGGRLGLIPPSPFLAVQAMDAHSISACLVELLAFARR
jgi:hypothetical protein